MMQVDSSTMDLEKPSSFRNIWRQNSKKLGDAAESVILPMNKRSFKRRGGNKAADLERQYSTTSSASDEPERHFPIFIVLISLIQIGMMILSKQWTWLSLCYDPYRRHELWRLISVMFVHNGILHLTSNVIFQLILGLLLEVIHGWKRVGAIYILSVLGGCLAITVIQPNQYAVGASAGVYGLLMAHFVTIMLNWNQMEKRIIRLVCLSAYIAFDITITVLSQNQNVSNAGHIGGAVTGFIAASFILRNFEKLKWEIVFQRILAGIAALALLFIIIVNIGCPSYYFPTEFNFEYLKTYINYVLEHLSNKVPGFRELFEDTCGNDKECREYYSKFFSNSTISSINSTMW